MRITSIVLLLVFLAPKHGYGTTHIAYYDGKNVYIGSDSKRVIRTLRNGVYGEEPVVACKVVTRNHIIALFSGRTSSTFALRRADGTERIDSRFEIHLRVADILKKAEPMQTKFKEIQEQTLQTLTEIYRAERGLPKPDLEYFDIEVTLISFEGNTPKLWMERVGITDWNKGPDAPQVYANGVSLLVTHPLLATSREDPAYKEFMSSTVQDRYRGKPIDFVRAFLNRESMTRIDEVGKPYTIIELSPGELAPKLLEGREVCTENYVPN